MEGDWNMFGVVVKISVNVYIYSPFDLKLGGSYAYFQEKSFQGSWILFTFSSLHIFFAKDLYLSKLQREICQKYSNYKSDDIDKLSA